MTANRRIDNAFNENWFASLGGGNSCADTMTNLRKRFFITTSGNILPTPSLARAATAARAARYIYIVAAIQLHIVARNYGWTTMSDHINARQVVRILELHRRGNSTGQIADKVLGSADEGIAVDRVLEAFGQAAQNSSRTAKSFAS